MSKARSHKTVLVIDNKFIRRGLSLYSALLHPLRLEIMKLVQKSGEINVTSLIHLLKEEQSVVSSQLRVLREARFLIAVKRGRSVFYFINLQQLSRVSSLSEKLIGPKTLERTPDSHYSETEKKDQDPVAFTTTEYKIIKMICQEKTSEEMARKLKLSRRTIEDYRTNLIRKMKVRNSVGILLYAVKHGIIELENS